ncbi:MAG: benzoate-CoA ligase family protein [Proteobacteria bacterium]|nr:benzoate-CoA ligase family protein [Pseudomonadota bacterium]
MGDYRDLIYSDEWRAWEDPEIPEYFNPTSILLDKHLGTAKASAIALIVDDDRYSYESFLAHVCRAANGLQLLKLGHGSRLLLFGTDSLEFLAIWFGAIRAGIVPVVISDAYKAPNLLYFLRDSSSQTLFIDAEQTEKLAEIVDDIPWTLDHVIVRGADPAAAPESGDRHILTYTELVEGLPGTFAPVPLHKNDVTYMFYSGGTTGAAKGITHLAHDFFLVPERHGSFLDYRPDDVVHATSKKYFTHGIWPAVLIPFYLGATSVISRLPPTAENVVAVVERARPTKLITVPTIIKTLLLFAEQERVPDFSSLEVVTSASEKMPPEVFEQFHKLFGLEVLDSIGSSEITYEWIANRPSDFRRGSLGRPVFGFEAKLMDSDGNEVTAAGMDGEAWIKSTTACFFYWCKLDKTKETFVGEWARTGDTLQFDEDGYFWFSGRSDDVFKVKGMWVSPIEVEAAITEHEAVMEAAVVSFEDSDGLTQAKAFIVLNPGVEISDDLVSALKDGVRRIGGYKVPAEMDFVAALPRTTLMKIDRRTLREMEAENRGRG